MSWRRMLSVFVDVHLGGQGKPVNLRVQAADAVRKLFRQHGDGTVGQVDTGPALIRLLVEERSLGHVLGDVGDMDPEPPAAADLLDGDGVVEVPGLFSVDGDRRQVPKVAPALAKGRGHFLGDHRRLGKCRAGERYREFVLLNDELGIDPGVSRFSDDPDDPAFGRSALQRVGDDLGGHQVTGPCRAGVLGAHHKVLGDPLVRGRNEPEAAALGSARFIGPDDPGARALQDADDDAFPLAGRFLFACRRRYPHDHLVAVHGVQPAGGGHVNIGFSLCIGDDESEARGMGLEPARFKVHLFCEAVPVPAGLDDLAFADQFCQDMFEVVPVLDLELELAHDLAHHHRFASYMVLIRWIELFVCVFHFIPNSEPRTKN